MNITKIDKKNKKLPDTRNYPEILCARMQCVLCWKAGQLNMTKAEVVIEFAQTSKYNNIRKMNVKQVNK